MEPCHTGMALGLLVGCFKESNPLIKAHWELRPHLKELHEKQETIFWNYTINEVVKNHLNIVVKHHSDKNKVIGVGTALDYAQSKNAYELFGNDNEYMLIEKALYEKLYKTVPS